MGIVIEGIVKSSLIDFPGKISAIIFLGGCNFRCGYCHNPEMVFYNESTSIDKFEKNDIIDFLRKRKRFLDGVCISGGEPTMSMGLSDFIVELKSMGYAVKLDTNGSNPSVISSLIEKELVDYVAMDIKGPYEKYQKITGREVELENIKASANLLAKAHSEGKLLAEYRTTVCREQLSFEDLEKMVKEHPYHPPWYFQKFNNPGKILDQKNIFTAYKDDEMKTFGEKLCVSVR